MDREIAPLVVENQQQRYDRVSHPSLFGDGNPIFMVSSDPESVHYDNTFAFMDSFAAYYEIELRVVGDDDEDIHAFTLHIEGGKWGGVA